MQAALDAFASNGFYGTSLRAVAQVVGISHVGLAHHFKTKEELLAAVLAHRDEVSRARLAPLVNRPLEDVLVTLVRHNQETPALVRLYATLSSEACDPAHPAHEHFRSRYATGRALFAARLGELQSAGELSPGLDPHLAAGTILAVLDGLQVQWLLDPDFDQVAALRSFLQAFLR